MRRPRPRLPHFPRHDHRAGAALVVVMGLALALAAGIPGVAGGTSASDNWIDLQLRTRLVLDAQVQVVGADGHEDRDLVAQVLADKRAAERGATRPPLRRIDFRAMARRAAVAARIRRPELFVRQIAAESGMQPCATSYAGAIGIAQIMPGTASSWKVDPWLPPNALIVAARNMARYERQLGSYRLALAAYNAGPGAVQQYGGVPPYAETREYIRRIMDPAHPLPGMTQVFEVPQGMTPNFRRRLARLVADVRARGGRLVIEEGWRSYEDATRIWKETKKRRGGWRNAKAWAAPPGCSNHTRGWAADLKGNLPMAHRLAARHGLVFPMSHEPWHVELAGIPTQSG